jgi:hypothetical protein
MGNKQVCKPNGNAPQCISACDISVQNCTAPDICYGPTGECRPDNCTTFPDKCSASQVCISGTCVSNPCTGVNCPSGEYCVGGNCVGSCADVECPANQRCRLGMCETDPCNGTCSNDQACDDDTSECVGDPCKFVQCSPGQECDPNHGGRCVNSPCVGTACPEAGQICKLGTCYDPAVFTPDGGMQYVTTGGGGGCAAGGGAGGLAGLAAALALLVARNVKRRRS